MKQKKKDFFWISFSDLMTSLFFVMLVLFVLVFALQSKSISELQEKSKQIEKQKAELEEQKSILEAQNKDLNAAKKELELIKKVKKALDQLDPNYFSYSETYKKHILNIPKALFKSGSFNMVDMSLNTRIKIRDAGSKLKELMKTLPQEDNVRYLLVIEGQASRDNFSGNNKLSYNRAQALRDFWFGRNVNLNNVLPNCEVVIAGSGQYGVPRIKPDRPPNNQRFLITIVPKIGNL